MIIRNNKTMDLFVKPGSDTSQARARTDRLVSPTAQGGDCSPDREMGSDHWRAGGRVGRETDENQMGHVQY